MRDIRPIKQHEASAFLRLLCDVFGLDYSRAESVFFNEPLFDLNRKWALFEGREMLSILTTVPLEFGWGNAIGIAGVATLASRRREGLGALLLEKVLRESKKVGECEAYLFAKDRRLYERIGFRVIDEVIKANISETTNHLNAKILGFDEVKAIYNDWASHDEARLRRDDRRWNYWRWNLRVCAAVSDGYACVEGGTVRECVAQKIPEQWGLGDQLEWFGLRTMSEMLQIEVVNSRFELYFMGTGDRPCPQMYLTDQF